MTSSSLLKIPIDSKRVFTSVQISQLKPNIPQLNPKDYMTWFEYPNQHSHAKIVVRFYQSILFLREYQTGKDTLDLIKAIVKYARQLNLQIDRLVYDYKFDSFKTDNLQQLVQMGFSQPQLKQNGIIRVMYTTKSEPNTLERCIYISHAYRYCIHLSDRSLKTFFLDSYGIDQLKEKLYDDREWFCNWKKKSSNELVIDSNSWRISSENDPFAVDIRLDSKYACHTHPLKAYLYYGTLFGSPSASDFYTTIVHYKEFRFHFVVSMEGIYQIEISPEVKMLLLFFEIFYPNCVDLFTQLFRIYMANENSRKIKVIYEGDPQVEQKYQEIRNLYDQGIFKHASIHQTRQQQIQHLLDYVNQSTITKLVRFVPSKNHVLDTEDRKILAQKEQLIHCIHKFTDINFNLCHLRFVDWQTATEPIQFDAIDYVNPNFKPFVGLQSDKR